MAKSEFVKIRLEPEEKQAFEDAANFAGVSLSSWMRERLRKSARIELEDAGHQIAFLRRNGNVPRNRGLLNQQQIDDSPNSST